MLKLITIPEAAERLGVPVKPLARVARLTGTSRISSSSRSTRARQLLAHARRWARASDKWAVQSRDGKLLDIRKPWAIEGRMGR